MIDESGQSILFQEGDDGLIEDSLGFLQQMHEKH